MSNITEFKMYYPIQKAPFAGKPLMLNQKFGENLNPLYKNLGMKGHNGWDLYAETGFKVYAAHDGHVTYAGLDGSNGYTVVIMTNEKHWYQGNPVFFKTIYGHLQKGSVFVVAGQQVKAGDLIAFANNSGASTGPHLHFGLKPTLQGEEDWVWWNYEQNNGYNGAIDPEPYFNGFFAEDIQKLVPMYQALISALQKMVEEYKKQRT